MSSLARSPIARHESLEVKITGHIFSNSMAGDTLERCTNALKRGRSCSHHLHTSHEHKQLRRTSWAADEVAKRRDGATTRHKHPSILLEHGPIRLIWEREGHGTTASGADAGAYAGGRPQQ